MTDVLVALDDSRAAEAVLRTALLHAESLGRPLRAIHAGPEPLAVADAAAASGVTVEILSGPAEDAVLEAATDPSVDLVVVGLHRLPGRHVTGHMVHALAGRTKVPLVVVPPCKPVRSSAGRILFPLDGTRRVSAAARPLIASYVAAGVEVLALHVYQPATVPMFHDGPQDEEVWRDEFLAQHVADLDIRLTTRPGPLVPALLQAAVAYEVDVIALASRPDAATVVSSVLHELLTSADRPVALVPLPRASAVGLDTV